MAKFIYGTIEAIVLVPFILVGALILGLIHGWRFISLHAFYDGDALRQERHRLP